MKSLIFFILLSITFSVHGQMRRYAIGDTAFCGIVFYVENIDTLGRQHGLVCASGDASSGVRWYNGSYITTLAIADRLFDKANADTIIRKQGDSIYAATVSERFQPDSTCTNWYLPSKTELNLIYVNLAKKSIGGFAKEGYWSSVEGGTGVDSLRMQGERRAWIIDFFDGRIFPSDKTNKWRVRPVREFRNFRD